MKENISNEKKEEIEKNKYVINNIVDPLFVYNHYGQCDSFLNEILKTEGITPEEHEKLNEILMRKTRWETRGGQLLVILYGFFHLGLVVKATGTISKSLIALSYPFFFFDVSYNLGRLLGNSLIMSSNLNNLLNLRQGNSINSIQTILFVKTCVYEDILIKSEQIPAKTLQNSFFINKIFGKSVYSIKEMQNNIMKIFNQKKEIWHKRKSSREE